MGNDKLNTHKTLIDLLYHFQLKLTERWIAGDKESLEDFINTFADNNDTLEPYKGKKDPLLSALILLRTDGEITDKAYSKLLQFT